MANINTMDRIAMYLGGGLIVLALPVIGFIVTVAGSKSPLYAFQAGEQSGMVLSPALAPQGAQIVTSPVVDPLIRGYLVLLGLVIFALLGIYKLFTPSPDASTTTATPAD
ncbi:MAG: hypothetical protein ABEJ59_00160 [Halanaeroarchaeum sp.]